MPRIVPSELSSLSSLTRPQQPPHPRRPGDAARPPPPADPACPAAQTPPAHLVLPRAGWGQSDGSHRAWVSSAPPGGRRAACPGKQRHTPPGSTHCVGEAFTTELVLRNEREHSGRMLGAHRSRGRAVGQLPDRRTRGAMRGQDSSPRERVQSWGAAPQTPAAPGMCHRGRVPRGAGFRQGCTPLQLLLSAPCRPAGHSV